MTTQRRALSLLFSVLFLFTGSAYAQIDGGDDPPPRIFGISPTSGPAGTTISVGGQHFQPYGSAQIGFVGAPFTYVSPYEIRVTVPAGATSARVVYQTQSGTTASPETFIVTTSSAPAVSGFSPSTGHAGDQVQITGAGFSSGARASFGGAAATTYFNSETSLTAIVPAAAASGPITVTTSAGSATSSQSFIVVTPAPTITSFSPAAAHAGDLVSINGTALDGVSSVTFNGTQATFRLVGGIQIQATVPNLATTGPIRVSSTNGSATSTSSFVVLEGYVPAITGFSPASGRAGTIVDIAGGNLDRITNAGFNGTAASALTLVSPSLARATVPQGAVSGPITVNGPFGSATSAASFQVILDPPTISSFTPASARPGDAITVIGTNFDGTARVTINGVAATTTLLSQTSLSFVVPVNATTGLPRVTTAGGVATSTSSLTVLPSLAPTITSFSPYSGPAGTNVTIEGTNLQTTRFVSFNGVSASFHTASGMLIATVPAAATTGRILVRNDYGEARSPGSFLVSGTRPRVSISTILNGKTYSAGAQVTIGWYTALATGRTVASHLIELSTDGGETWISIAQLPAGAQSKTYVLTIPALWTSRGVVRITARDSAGESGSDITDGYFTILTTPDSDLTASGDMLTIAPGQTARVSGRIKCDPGGVKQAQCTQPRLGTLPEGFLQANLIIPGAPNGCNTGFVKTCGTTDDGTCGRYTFELPTKNTIDARDYTFNVVTSGGPICPSGLVKTFTVRVVAPAISVVKPPAKQTVIAGDEVAFKVNVKRNGYAGPLDLELTSSPNQPGGLPNGGTPAFTPGTRVPSNSDAFATESVTVTLFPTAPRPGVTPTPAGTYELLLIFRGENGIQTSTVLPFDVVVEPNLFITIKPFGEATAGVPIATKVNVHQYGFKDDVTLVITDSELPVDAFSISAEPERHNLSPFGVRLEFDLFLTPPQTAVGSFSFTIRATHGNANVRNPSDTSVVNVKPRPVLVIDNPPMITVAVRNLACAVFPITLRRIDFPGTAEVRLRIEPPPPAGIEATVPGSSTFIGDDDVEMETVRFGVSRPSNQNDLRIEYTFVVIAEHEPTGVKTESIPLTLIVEPGNPIVKLLAEERVLIARPGMPKVFRLRVDTRSDPACPAFFAGMVRLSAIQNGDVQPVFSPDPMDGNVTLMEVRGNIAGDYPFLLTAEGAADGTPLDIDPATNNLLFRVTDAPIVNVATPSDVLGTLPVEITWTIDEQPSLITSFEVSLVEANGTLRSTVTRVDPNATLAYRAEVIPENPPEDAPFTLMAKVRALDLMQNEIAAGTSKTFQVQRGAPPEIFRIAPTEAYAETILNIFGKKFVRGKTKVTFSNGLDDAVDVNGTVIGALDQVQVVVPAALNTQGRLPYVIKVTTPIDPPAQSPDLFRLLTDPPTVRKVDPTTAKVTDTITLTGTGFVSGKTTVLFRSNDSDGMVSASGSVVSLTTLTTVVPMGAVSGNVEVMTPRGTSFNNVQVIITK